jgi:hypothetical protein
MGTSCDVCEGGGRWVGVVRTNNVALGEPRVEVGQLRQQARRAQHLQSAPFLPQVIEDELGRRRPAAQNTAWNQARSIACAM